MTIGFQTQNIPIAKIVVDPERGRKDFSRIGELIAEIQRIGLLHPLNVYPKDGDTYGIISGERRLRACTALGWTHVPCVVRENDSALTRKEVELVENVCRQDLSPLERAFLLKQIDDLKKKQHGIGKQGDRNGAWTMEKTAALTGYSPTEVQRSVKVAKKLEARPDLVDKVKHLPMSRILGELAQIEQNEKLERMHDQGLITLSKSLLEGDCVELIKSLPESSVDLILTDPPFGITTLADMEGDENDSVQTYINLMEPDDNATADEYLTMLSQLLPQFKRVLKPGGHVYMFHAPQLWGETVKHFTTHEFGVQPYPIIWYKGRSTSRPTGYSYMACYEPILFAWKEPRRKLTQDLRALFEIPIVNSKDRIHIFEKPGDLLDTLIKQSCPLGGTVLDPFAGSGKTLQRALALGRSAIGFEKNHKHFLAAQSRLIDTPKLGVSSEGEGGKQI